MLGHVLILDFWWFDDTVHLFYVAVILAWKQYIIKQYKQGGIFNNKIGYTNLMTFIQ